jgi:succinate dehydrogenase / fumarate reductase membrane anchor subunit
MNKYVTPLSKAKGLGSAKDGTHHFWMQRITALALIPLTLWFGFSLALLPQTDYAHVLQWLQSPFNSILSILFLLTSFHHGQLGMQVIIEDYIASTPVKLTALILTKLAAFLFAAIGIYAIVTLSLGA